MAELRCPSCSELNAESQKFCGNCGTRLERECPRCGQTNPGGFSFCGNCGAALTAPVVPSATEERRWATVLFADLSGFTELSERTDPEEVRAIADRCTERLGAIVGRFGGWVNRVIGDAILAVFGAPVAHEDDAERAVRAALEMKQCALDHAEEFGNLTLRIGINTGELMFAPVGPEGARDTTVMGDVVNTAARLQTAAPTGEILVGEPTFETTRHVIRYTEIEPFRAKGKESLLRAWKPLAVLAAPADRAVSAAPLVGRDRELALLLQIWDRTIAEARPHLVSVVGPPGIGKTRLSREFGAAAAGRVVRGRSLPYGELTGYGAFAQQLKGLADIFDSDSVQIAAGKIERLTERLLESQAADVVDQMKVILGVGDDASPDRQVLFYAARRLVEAIAREEPTIFLFEDVHWADASLLDLVEALASRTRDAPALFLTLSRPELLNVRPTWGGGLTSYTALPLEPLGEADARDLALHFLEEAGAANLARELGERAEGNPLFIEELAVSMTERAEAAIGRLPTHVQGIIAARLDSLPAGARSALLDASVVGKVFWRGALARMNGGEDLGEALDVLEARDFIRREPSSAIEGDAQFTFKHMLIREVAYGTVPKAGRRERHAVTARYIEDAAGERLAESASLLAHHWKEAGEPGKAIDYLLMAADRAQKAWANKEGVRLLDEALEMMPPDQDHRRRSVSLFKARLLNEVGDYAATVALLEPLIPEFSGVDLAEAIFLRGLAEFWTLNVEGIRHCAVELTALAGGPGGDDFAGPALYLTQMVEGMDGRLAEALAAGEQAISATWLPGRFKGDLANARTLLGINLVWAGRFDDAERHSRAAYESARELNNVEVALNAGGELAAALTGQGRHEEALAVVDSVVSEWREFEMQPRLTARALNMWSGALRELFLIEESRERNAEAIELGKISGFQNAISQGIVDLLFADLAEGDVGPAVRRLPEAEDEARKLRGWHEWLVLTRLREARAWIALQTASPDEAASLAAAALETAVRHGRLKYEIGSRLALAAALERLDHAQDARGQLRRALEAAEVMAHPPTLWRAAAALGGLLYRIGDDGAAEAAYTRAQQVAAEFAGTLSAEHRSVFLDAPEVASILAGHTG